LISRSCGKCRGGAVLTLPLSPRELAVPLLLSQQQATQNG